MKIHLQRLGNLLNSGNPSVQTVNVSAIALLKPVVMLQDIAAESAA